LKRLRRLNYWLECLARGIFEKMVRLIIPSEKYYSSYQIALKEFHDEGRDLEYRGLKKGESFADFVGRLENFKLGKGLPESYVPETILWLVDDNDYIGEASIRHSLTDSLLKWGGHIGYFIRPSKRQMGYGKEILKLALKEAKKLGISKVLVTCDETNIGSYKIIEANGGILENAFEMGEGKPRKLRYWIRIL
jgi:predicted acetyltransferase